MTQTKHTQILQSFIEYCESHPEERFWQALCNWSGWAYLRASMNDMPGEDTFFWPDDNPIIEIDKYPPAL